jgi:hypothetical protein
MSAPALRIDAPLPKLKRLQELRRKLADLDTADAEFYRGDIAAWARDRLGVRPVVQTGRDRPVGDHGTAAPRCSPRPVSGSRFLAAVISAVVDRHPPARRGHRRHHRPHRGAGAAPSCGRRSASTTARAACRARCSAASRSAGCWTTAPSSGWAANPPTTPRVRFRASTASYVLVILDEAGGVASEMLWAGAEAITTNEDCRILAIGNPDDNSSSKFAEGVLSTGRAVASQFKVSAYRHPQPDRRGRAARDALRCCRPGSRSTTCASSGAKRTRCSSRR